MMHMRFIGTLVLATLGILVALLISLPGESLEEEQQEGHWGKAVEGLSCSIRSDKESYGLGENIPLDILFRSETDLPLTVIQPKVYFTYCNDALPLEIKGPRGLCKYHGPVLEPPPPYGKRAYKELVRGEIIGVSEVYRHPIRVVPEYWSIDVPGTFRIRLRFVRKSNDYYSQGKSVPIHAWEGELFSNTMTIRVVADPSGTPAADEAE